MVACESLEELRLPPTKEKDADFDLNDELQNMQDIACYSIYKKRSKKGRRYKEWKTDAIREDDGNQLKFLEKQLQRMRKKEENPVNRKAVTKRNTNPCCGTNQMNGSYDGQGQNCSYSQFGRPATGALQLGGSANRLGMNMRTRVK